MITARLPRGPAFRSLVLAAAIALAAGAGLASGPAGAQGSSSINIPFERYTLPNGLTVITSLDRTTPTVAVNMWYHVGSKNEAKGRTGFSSYRISTGLGGRGGRSGRGPNPRIFEEFL